MKVFVFGILAFLVFWTNYAAWATHDTVNYSYMNDRNDEKTQLKLTVKKGASSTEVVFYTAKGDQEITVFDNERQHITKAVYIKKDGSLFAQVDYDYVKCQISISGEINTTYTLEPSMYENNGSLFYVFASWPLSQQCANKEFKLIQSNMIHMSGHFYRWFVLNCIGPIPMRLSYVGDEKMMWSLREQDVKKYVLQVNEPTMASFWPHQYVFYYRKGDNLLLRFDGMDGQGGPLSYCLVDENQQFSGNNFATK